MKFRLKIILVVILQIVVIVVLAGYLGFQGSQVEIEKLAEELVRTKTEMAFDLADHHLRSGLQANRELMTEIGSVQIAQSGYVCIIDNTDGGKGILLVHPSDVGRRIYNESFPHIMAILDEIDRNGKVHGYSNLTRYRQHTGAMGRQGEMKIGYFKYFEPWQWVILSTGYESDIYASRTKVGESAIKVAAIVIVLGSVFVYLTIKRMFRPVQRLKDSTQEVARGNWDITIENRSNDEIGALAQSFNAMVQSLRENAHIWNEFKIAREMQASMLPDEFPEIAGLQIAAKSIPALEVGGDFYDFLNSDRSNLGIVIGDVSGHGVSAAMVMTAAMCAVRFAAEEKPKTDEVLKSVNSRLYEDIQRNMFVALFYGIINPKTRRLYYSNAGQAEPILYRNDEVRFLPKAEDDNHTALGMAKAADYQQYELKLRSDDILVFYTDGLVEMMDGSSEPYGYDRLVASIRRHANADSSGMVGGVLHEVAAYGGKEHFHDDVTMVVVKIA